MPAKGCQQPPHETRLLEFEQGEGQGQKSGQGSEKKKKDRLDQIKIDNSKLIWSQIEQTYSMNQVSKHGS